MINLTLKTRLLGTSVLFVLAGAAGPALAQSETGGGSVETIVVTGTRAQAQAIKQDAPNVLDVRPVDEIQKLPDVNIAEALQRVPGVSLESDSGEGRFVNIRGMDADLNGTTFDGVRLTASNPSTPQGGARAVAFDAFPSGLFGGVEVIKSLTPDIDAEGLGGIVNLLPRNVPVGRDLVAEATIGSGTETLRGSPVWDGGLTIGGRFGPHDSISALISFDYHEDWRGIDDLENSGPSTVFTPNGAPIDNDLEFRWYKYHRIRHGYGANFSWDLDANSTLFLRAFDAGYTEYAHKNRLEIDNTNVCTNTGTSTCDVNGVPIQQADGSFIVDDAQAVKAYTDSKETIGNKLVEFGGHTVFGEDILADFRVSWTEGTDYVPWSYGFSFKNPNDTMPFQFNPTVNPNTPSFKALDGTDLTDPANYTVSKLSVSSNLNSDSEMAGAFNFTAPLNFGGYDGALKFGGSIRERVGRANASNGGTVKNVGALSLFAQSNDEFDGPYNVGPMANLPVLAALAAPAAAGDGLDPSAFQHNDENVYAGYVQYSTTIGALSLLGGVRIETTNASYAANFVDNLGNVSPNVIKQDYTNVFPDLNAKYQVTDDLVVRGAFTTSLARPGFNQITGAESFDFDANSIGEGNPNVKATTADNVDLTAEYYLPKGGIAAIGLFYKSFSNYTIPTTVTVPATDFPSEPFTGPLVHINSFANVGAATTKGVELNYIQQFVFLPEPIDGFGFEGNFTYNDSDGDIRVGEKHALPQTSPYNYNAAIFYEKYGFTARIAASFVSKNLWVVGGDATQDLYSQNRFRLDFGSSYDVTDNVSVYFNVKNITNTKLEFTQTPSKMFPVQREYYNVDYLFGVKAQL